MFYETLCKYYTELLDGVCATDVHFSRTEKGAVQKCLLYPTLPAVYDIPYAWTTV